VLEIQAVYDEARTLAQRTPSSTEEIRKIIGRLQNQTQHSSNIIEHSTEQAHKSVETTNSAGEALSRIVNALATINDMNDQIAVASEEQTTVAGEIGRCIVSISDSTKTTATEAGANAHEINDIVTEMQRLNEKVSAITT